MERGGCRVILSGSMGCVGEIGLCFQSTIEEECLAFLLDLSLFAADIVNVRKNVPCSVPSFLSYSAFGHRSFFWLTI